MNAAFSLGRMGEHARDAVPALAHASLHEPDEEVQQKCSGSPQEVLLEDLGGGGMWTLDWEARRALLREVLQKQRGWRALAVGCGAFTLEESSLVVEQVKQWQQCSEKKWEKPRWVLWGFCASLRERFGAGLAWEREAWKSLLQVPLEALREAVLAHKDNEHKQPVLATLGELFQTLRGDREIETALAAEIRDMDAKLFD